MGLASAAETFDLVCCTLEIKTLRKKHQPEANELRVFEEDISVKKPMSEGD